MDALSECNRVVAACLINLCTRLGRNFLCMRNPNAIELRLSNRSVPLNAEPKHAGEWLLPSRANFRMFVLSVPRLWLSDWLHYDYEYDLELFCC